MVGQISTTHHVIFIEHDMPINRSFHNDPLHLEVYIHKHERRWVLVGAKGSLNICTLKIVQTLDSIKAI